MPTQQCCEMQEWRFPFSAMGSPCEIRLYATRESGARQVAAAAEAEVRRLEQVYSRYRDDSITTRINTAAGGDAVEVDPETASLLDYAATAYKQSDGLFDITSGVLRRAWDFHSGKLPDKVELENLLSLVGWNRVEWNSPFIRLPESGMELDFGGYVKEYAVDAALRVCKESGVAHGLIDLGGDIQIIGPHPDGSPWRVGVRNPRAPDEAIVSIELISGALASSGDYERYMEVGGKRYCHILNPETGWPVQGLAGISIAAPLCILAGTAATVAMLKGREAGPDWLEELGLPHFWVTPEGKTGGNARMAL